MADAPLIIVPDRRIVSPSEAISTDNWDSLSSYSHSVFYKPDMQAVEIVLTAICGQFDPHSQPIWLFINGPSGSSKTALCINPMMGLPNIYCIDTLTPHTLLSGYIGSPNAGLLPRIGPSGTILMPDFTTILSLRDDNRKEIFGQFRRVYDGQYDLENGANTGKSWKGKVTIIAAVTPVIERYWGLFRDMGERWLQVRWERLDGPSVAKMSRSQQGKEKMIADTLLNGVTRFFTTPRINYSAIPEPSDSQGNSLDCLSEIVCYVRAPVNREATGNREIRDVPVPEQTGRIGKGLPAIARYHAILRRRDYINDSDMAIVRRVAIDSMPHTRGRILMAIPPLDTIAADDLSKLLSIPPSTLKWNLDELDALGVITMSSNSMGVCVEMSKHIREMWRVAFSLDS